jgi:hypothetical protein
MNVTIKRLYKHNGHEYTRKWHFTNKGFAFSLVKLEATKDGEHEEEKSWNETSSCPPPIEVPEDVIYEVCSRYEKMIKYIGPK